MSVESQIVTMIFENTKFAGPVNATLGVLSKLKTALSFGKEQQQLGQLEAAGSRFNMGNMGAAVEGVSGKFLALTTVAITALANITNRAIDAGLSFAKSFTFAPVMDGLREYETNLKAIQTVQANTDRPLPEINKALEQLNAYSDQTIYNFGEMAKNVGTFTAAGVDLQTSVSSIKGIANLAALSGSSSQQAATAMYQLSQAISSGRVGLQDWNSVVNAGMGGKKLQNALAQTAIAMGDIGKNSVKLEGPMKKLTINGKSFRESIMAQPGQESWLSSDILVNTLSAMDGRFSKAALSAELTETGVRKFTDAQVEAQIAQARLNMEQKNGVKFTDEQFAALQTMSTSAFKAATEVKTLGQVFDIAKETIGSGWSASFKSIFGNLNEAKKTFTGMSEAIGGVIKANALARNQMLVGWKEQGGRKAIIKGMQNVWVALGDAVFPIKQAFDEIFPPMTAERLVALSKQFARFTHSLRLGEDTMTNLKRTAAGVFAVFSIAKQIIGGFVGVIFDLIKGAGVGNGSILEFTGGIGDFLVSIDTALKKGDGLKNFFAGLTDILQVPIEAIKSFAGFLIGMFDGFDASEVGKAFGPVKERADQLATVGERLGGIWARVGDIFGRIGDFFGPLAGMIGEAFGNIGDAIADAFSGADYSSAMDALNVGLLGGIALLLRNFLKNGFKLDLGGGGVLESLKDTLDGVTGSLKAMQMTLQAKALLAIAGAIALLTASVVVLSMIDSAKLSKALTAMSAGFAQLLGSFAILTKLAGPKGFATVPAAATALVALATAILILSVAMKIMSTMSWEEIAKGLTAVTGMLIGLSGAAYLIGLSSGGIFRAGIAMIPLAIGLGILGVAMKLFATMSWEEIGKGMAIVTGALAAISIAMMLMPPSAPLIAAGIVGVAIAMNILGGALKLFATMSWEDIGKGMTVLVGALTAIGIALTLIPPTAPLIGAALLLVAGAMVVLGGALKLFATMSWEEIGKGMAVLAGSLTILALGLTAMIVALPGAAALLVAAAALAVLAPVLVTLGQQDLATLAKGLGAIAAIFVILGAAGYLLGPVVIVIVGLGAAMLALGAGMALVGAGAFLLATAFGIFTAAGAAGIAMVTQLITLIPGFFKFLGEGVVAFAEAIGRGAPAIMNAFKAILLGLLQLVIDILPKLGEVITKLVQTFMKVLRDNFPNIAATGFQMLMSLLNEIDKNMEKVVDRGASIIKKFIRGIAENIGDIIDEGFKLIVKFLEGIAKAIRENGDDITQAGLDIADAILDGIVEGLKDVGGRIKGAIDGLVGGIGDKFKDGLGVLTGSPSLVFRDIVEHGIGGGIVDGLKRVEAPVNEATNKLANSAVDTMKTTLAKMADGIDEGIINLDPTITPILDLTKLQADATRIGGMLSTTPIEAGVSYNQAADIFNKQQADAAAAAAAAPEPGENSGGDTITFEQNIYSPKPLSTSEVYRQTHGQLSMAEEALRKK